MWNGLYDFRKRGIRLVAHPLNPKGIVLVISAKQLMFGEIRLSYLWYLCRNTDVMILHQVLSPGLV